MAKSIGCIAFGWYPTRACDEILSLIPADMAAR